MAEPVLLTARHGKVALLTLNRPQARNALNAELSQALCDAIAANQDAGCIVITGADPAFCAGLDLRNLGADRLADFPSYTEAMAASQIPMIAAVNGPAVTGGFEVALLCDFMIASERATFADHPPQGGRLSWAGGRGPAAACWRRLGATNLAHR